MKIPPLNQAHVTEHLADLEHLINVLDAQPDSPREVIQEAQTQLRGFWQSWQYWEFGTDRFGNDHDGEEAYERQADLEREMLTLSQCLVRTWHELRQA